MSTKNNINLNNYTMDIRISTLKNMLGDNAVIDINENDEIIVTGDIIILDNEYNMFPVKIHKVNGNIYWKGFSDGFKYGSLTSLTNFPDIVTGNVNISKNKGLTSLVGCPKEIGGTLCCETCNITSLDGLDNVCIGGNLFISDNNITNIPDNTSITVKGNVEFINTSLNIEELKNILTVEDSSIITAYDNSNILFE